MYLLYAQQNHMISVFFYINMTVWVFQSLYETFSCTIMEKQRGMFWQCEAASLVTSFRLLAVRFQPTCLNLHQCVHLLSSGYHGNKAALHWFFATISSKHMQTQIFTDQLRGIKPNKDSRWCWGTTYTKCSLDEAFWAALAEFTCLWLFIFHQSFTSRTWRRGTCQE